MHGRQNRPVLAAAAATLLLLVSLLVILSLAGPSLCQLLLLTVELARGPLRQLGSA